MFKKVSVSQFPTGTTCLDTVATEEPMEIRVNGQSCAVLMRTPGMDRELTAGFLLTEGLVDGADDIKAIAPCEDPARPNSHNLILSTLAEGCENPEERLAKARRHFFSTSSCGLCGKATIENIHQNVRPHSDFATLRRTLVERMGEQVLARQSTFQKTGGLHAAALIENRDDGEIIALAEDIGRHNAVDKVLGQMLLSDHIPLTNTLLWVSGRSSFEVIQKALMGGVIGIICVGAPSSLAVELARESCLTLIGFAKDGGRFNLYCGQVS
ncbi:MAG TPA: formate dehydrogenase accessory sulfurtransferase FdhD [Myxococcales bacterium]|nr:formate dehydrogenase accessory sulfurtransferase FdhD [Myxococcales bacterium]